MRRLGDLNMGFNYLRFWVAGLRISFKQAVEFKSNFYSAIFLNVIFFFVIVFSASIFSSIFGDSIGWKFVDFVLFIFVLNLMFDFSGIFWYGSSARLEEQIKSGKLNSYFCKPGNRFLVFLLKPRSSPVIFILLDILFYIPYLIYLGDFIFFNILLGFLVLVCLSVCNVLLVYFLMSFSWIFIKLGSFLVDDFYWDNIQEGLRSYPFQLFENRKFLYLIFSVLPMFYVSTVVIPIISFGDFSVLSSINYYVLFWAIFVMGLGTFFNWRYGLRKYEAFG